MLLFCHGASFSNVLKKTFGEFILIELWAVHGIQLNFSIKGSLKFRKIIYFTVYLGKAKQCQLITETFYNNDFGKLSQIYRINHFYMTKLLSWILLSDVLKLFGKGYRHETLTVGSTLIDWQTVFHSFQFCTGQTRIR